jgi:hypothetical protein
MSINTNKHGLSRYIPAGVAREVRQRCGFGCVVCGGAIYEYDHFDPPFEDATHHHASGIALLCPPDHTRKASGLLSAERFSQAIEEPYAIANGTAWAAWDGANFAPEFWVGLIRYRGGTSILDVDGEILFGFAPPEDAGAPPLTRARFFDRNQALVFAIENNEITINSDSFDVEAIGNRWTIRSAPQNVDLEIRLEPPRRIIIPRIHYRYGRWGLDVDQQEFKLVLDGHPALAMVGPVTIEGPCLFKCDTATGTIRTENMRFVGGYEEE